MAKIIIYSPNVIGKAMAGAAIRPWEFARALAEDHQVVLLSPGPSDAVAEGFELLSLSDPRAKQHFRDADILIAQRLTFPLALLAVYHRLSIIIDAYVPGPLELLEHYKQISQDERQKKVFAEITNLAMGFEMADGILCASEKQRELWIGFLLGQKIITPSLYDRDASLRDYIDVVPFGLSEKKAQKCGEGLRERFHFSSADRVLIWGGGLWNWFDPLSLIHAMNLLSKIRSDIKLVFMGVVPPDPSLPQTAMAAEAIRLAAELGIIDRSVFFNKEWIPYEQRQNFLLDADIGVSTHFDHLETRYSFRTRLLDYIWAGLPIVATEGDAFAELIERRHLGRIVPYRNAEAIAKIIAELADDPTDRKRMQENLAVVREQFYWKTAIEPLNRMIHRLSKSPPVKSKWKQAGLLFHFLFIKVRERGILSCLQQYLFGKKPA